MTGHAANEFTRSDQNDLLQYARIVDRRKELRESIKSLQCEIDGMREAHYEITENNAADSLVRFKNSKPQIWTRWAESFTGWEAAPFAEYLTGKLKVAESTLERMESNLQALTDERDEIYSNINFRFGDTISVEPPSEG